MKTILSDAKSCEENDETKYTNNGGVTGLLCQNVGKITEKELKIERIKHFGRLRRRRLSSHTSLIRIIRIEILW